MRVRLARASALAIALASLAACGIGGSGRDIPPAPTAVPGASDVFVYVAEARDPVFGTDGGAISVYHVGPDGGLAGGPPDASVPVVNPRRLARHPRLPVLYALTRNQVLAFDISGGGLASLCGGEGTELAPPCATSPQPDGEPIDLVVAENEEGGFVLYVTERGSGNTLTRIVAYPLDGDGGLPGAPSSQARTTAAILYQGFAVVDGYGFAADLSRSGYDRFDLDAAGDLPDPAPTPSPGGAAAGGSTPSPGDEPTPTPSPEPTPSPPFFFLDRVGPGQTIVGPPEIAGESARPILYLVQRNRIRLGAITVDSEGNLPDELTSESETRGFYNDLLVVPSVRRIYAAGFQIGQIDSFALDESGQIVPDSLAATFANTAQFPTGIDYVELSTASGELRRAILVSLGGFDRVDAYAVAEDGIIAERPFSSTEPRTGTFPSDVLAYVAGR